MGIPTQHEPANMEALQRNSEVFSIFKAAGWTKFFQRLNGFHQEMALQFALNLTDTYSEVIVLHIDVTEDIVVEVIDLPREGRTWFGRRTHNATTMKVFFVASE